MDPLRRCTPPRVERLLPSVHPYPEASEDTVCGVSSDWMVFSITVWWPNEDWRYILHHIPTGVNTGTGLLSTENFNSAAFSPSGTVFFQGVYEPSEGTDLNGDGDNYDVVLHTFDLQALTTTNTGLAIGFEMSEIGTGTTVLFPVAETVDENGDGDTDDWIAYGGDLATNTITSSAVATSSERYWELWVEGNRGVWLVDEEAGKDYTGDGDFQDRVFHVYDFNLGAGLNLGLAPGALGLGAALTDGVFAFFVEEADQGQDLDADGDADDRVLHTFDFTTGALTNVGEAGRHPAIGSDRVAFRHETTGTLHVENLATGAVTDSGILMTGAPTYVEGHFVFEGVEEASDWNGDGDTDDHVLWVREAVSGNSFHLGVAMLPALWDHSTPWYRWTDSQILFIQDEAGQGATDLNGDGDALDNVWGLYSTDTSVVRSLELAAPGNWYDEGGLFDEFAALEVSEYDQGVDLNGDGAVFGKVWLTLCLNDPAVPPRVLDGTLAGSPTYTTGLGWWVLTLQAMDGDGVENDFAVAVFKDGP